MAIQEKLTQRDRHHTHTHMFWESERHAYAIPVRTYFYQENDITQQPERQ